MSEQLRFWLHSGAPVPGVFKVELDGGTLTCRMPDVLAKDADLSAVVLDRLLLLLRQVGVVDLAMTLELAGDVVEMGVPLSSQTAVRLSVRDLLPDTTDVRLRQIKAEIPHHVAESAEEAAGLLGLRPAPSRYSVELDALASLPPLPVRPDGPADLGDAARAALRLLGEHELQLIVVAAPFSPRQRELLQRASRPPGLRRRLLGGHRPPVEELPEWTGTVAVLAQALIAAVVQLGHDVDGGEALLSRFPLVRRYLGELSDGDPRLPPAVRPQRVRKQLADARGRELSLLLEQLQELERWLVSLELLPLERAVADLLEATGATRDGVAEALAARYGAGGGGVATLDEVGRGLGVTRERVRQIQRKVDERIPAGRLPCPALDQVEQILDVELPCTADHLTEVLGSVGLSDVPRWTGSAITAVGRRFGRELDVVDRDGLIVRSSSAQGHKDVATAARRVSDYFGVATEFDVVHRLQRDGVKMSSQQVGEALQLLPGLRRTVTGHFWLPHAKGRNRLVNTCLRVLAVIQPQTLSDLHEGVVRSFTWRASTGGSRFDDLVPPSEEVLAGFLHDHPAFRVVDGNNIYAQEAIELDELGPEKAAMVELLRAQPHTVMHRNAVIEACVAMGMNQSTASVFLTYAECIKRFGHNVWGLRGASVPPEALEQVQARAKRERQAVDSRKLTGVTASGRPWMARVITPTILYSAVLPFDWGREALAGRALRLVDGSDGEEQGLLRFTSNFNYGYAGLFAKNRPKIGHVIRVVADLEEDMALVELGGEELLSEPFDW